MEQNKETQLASCPFCGHDAILEISETDCAYIICRVCMNQTAHYERWKDAYKAWNTRKPPVVEAGEGVKWPEKVHVRTIEKDDDKDYWDGVASGYNQAIDVYTTILKQKGLL